MLNWSPGMTLESVEKAVILQAIAFYHGNKTVTAKALGCSPRTLFDKLEKYELDQKEQDARDAAARKYKYEFDRRQRGLPVESDANYQAPGINSPTITAGNEDHYRSLAREQERPASEQNNGDDSEQGIRVESASGVTEKPQVSVLKREEIQGVPFKPSSQSRNGRRG